MAVDQPEGRSHHILAGHEACHVTKLLDEFGGELAGRGLELGVAELRPVLDRHIDHHRRMSRQSLEAGQWRFFGQPEIELGHRDLMSQVPPIGELRGEQSRKSDHGAVLGNELGAGIGIQPRPTAPTPLSRGQTDSAREVVDDPFETRKKVVVRAVSAGKCHPETLVLPGSVVSAVEDASLLED